jgi:LmbE family N-acetylglucosaminyl deacetylase
MVTWVDNRIDGPGTAENDWQRWLATHPMRRANVAGWRSVVIVAAHPDDEVLGAGGIIATLAAARIPVRLVAVTDGDASHPGADRGSLARVRRAESNAALRLLGAQDIEVIRLGRPDTGVGAAEDDLAAQLAGLCRGFDVCLAPWEQDAHADHEATGRAARRGHDHVFRYPIWMWHWARPAAVGVPWDRALSVHLPDPVRARKRAAIGAFRSQLTSRSAGTGPVLSAEFIAHFARSEEVLFW